MAESRSTFHFKGFSLEHGDPGLKIGTEACIFGAYLAKWAHGNMLEIGTGSGVLAAMVAQFHSQETIDTVEIFPEVAQLARKNFEELPFKQNIYLIEGDIKDYKTETKYDFIFSNPPFFINHLSNSSKSKQTAMHSDELSPEQLLEAIFKHSKPDFDFAVLYPPDVMDEVVKSTSCNPCGCNQFGCNHSDYQKISCKERIEIIPNENGKVLREIALFSTEQSETKHSKLVIKNTFNEYTPEFIELLQPYYIIFP